MSARLQVESTIEQARHLAGTTFEVAGLWPGLRPKVDHSGVGATGSPRAVDHGRGAMAGFADYLESDYLPDTAEVNGVGRRTLRRLGRSLSRPRDRSDRDLRVGLGRGQPAPARNGRRRPGSRS